MQPQGIFGFDNHIKDCYIRSLRVQQCLVGQNAEWEDHLARWTLSVRCTLEASAAQPPAVMVASPEETGPMLENDSKVKELLKQGGVPPGATEGRQTTEGGHRDKPDLPGQGPGLPLQQTRRRRLQLAAREGKEWSQVVDAAGQENLGGGHKPVHGEDPIRIGGKVPDPA